jgi:hypothetical protein
MVAQPTGGLPTASDGSTVVATAKTPLPSRSVPVFCAEVSVAHPGSSASFAPTFGWGVLPWGALSLSQPSLFSTATIYASDVGYRTKSGEVGGAGDVQPYPPLLTEAFQMSRTANLDLTSAGAAAAWGAIVLSNVDGRFDAYPSSWNADRRAFSILFGRKVLDTTRGIFTDPSYAALKTYLRGMAGIWTLDNSGLTIPLRDASYWLDAPMQTSLYLGTGTYEGPATLAGVPKPKARGGTAASPICNVSPVLIDAANLVYQYTDGPGTVVNLYEGVAKTITFASDTTNLYSGTTPAGQYRTDNSRGLFQLGSVPASGYAITLDCTGSFPLAGVQTRLFQVVRYLMIEDLGLDPSNVDLAAFWDADAAYPYTAGWWWAPTAATASTEIPRLLSSVGAKLMPRRDGKLRPFVLRTLPATPPVVTARLDTTNIVNLSPQALPDTLSPPPYRIRVGWQHNFTVQTSGINTATSTAAQRAFVGLSDRFSTWLSTAIQSAYPRPNDPDAIVSALLVQADALTVANDLGALWGSGAPGLYSIEVPFDVAIGIDLGDAVSVRYPQGSLRSGAYGQIVGEQFDSSGATATFSVLI